MSKAEEKALKKYPKKIEWVGNQWDGAPFDVNSEKRFSYQQGYQQAEKDVAEAFAKIIRNNLNGIQNMFEKLYTDITGKNIYNNI